MWIQKSLSCDWISCFHRVFTRGSNYNVLWTCSSYKGYAQARHNHWTCWHYLAMMMGSALSSFFVGLFDIKHYFHLQVGVGCLWCRCDLIWLVGASYFSTPPSTHIFQVYLCLINLTGGYILVLAAWNTISRISELERTSARWNPALQLWDSHWKAVWKREICCK